MFDCGGSKDISCDLCITTQIKQGYKTYDVGIEKWKFRGYLFSDYAVIFKVLVFLGFYENSFDGFLVCADWKHVP